MLVVRNHGWSIVILSLVTISAQVLAFVFLTVGFSKLIGHSDFVSTLTEMPVVKNYIPLIAYPVPILVTSTGIILLFPKWRKIGFVSSLVLMLGFLFYNGYILWFADSVPCGCGGIVKGMSWTNHLYLNASLTLLAGTGTVMTLKSGRKKHKDILPI